MKRSLTAIIVLTCFFVQFLFPSPLKALTVTEEEKLSREFMDVVNMHFKLIKDPVIVDYVNDIGKRILSVLPPQPFEYRFYVVDEAEFNAFASPGGKIFIFRGVLENMGSEGELAGIISHEISHVVLRHISDQIENASKINLATLAGLVAGIFLGVGGASAAAQAVTIGAVGAGQSIQLAYSRENERQADLMGMENLISAGYDGTEMFNVLKHLRDIRWYDNVPDYLLSHPSAEERMAYLDSIFHDIKSRNRIESSPQTAVIESDSETFERVQTRLIALYADPERAIRRFQKRLADNPGDLMAHYGYGLTLGRAGRCDEAAEHIRIVLEHDPFDSILLTDLGRNYYSAGKSESALQALQGAAGIKPDDPETRYYLGRTYISLKEYDKAVPAFEKTLESDPERNMAHYFLGEAYGKLDQLGEAHYHLGLYNKNIHNLDTAAFHLTRAVDKLEDPDKRREAERLLGEIRKDIKKQKREAADKQMLNAHAHTSH